MSGGPPARGEEEEDDDDSPSSKTGAPRSKVASEAALLSPSASHAASASFSSSSSFSSTAASRLDSRWSSHDLDLEQEEDGEEGEDDDDEELLLLLPLLLLAPCSSPSQTPRPLEPSAPLFRGSKRARRWPLPRKAATQAPTERVSEAEAGGAEGEVEEEAAAAKLDDDDDDDDDNDDDDDDGNPIELKPRKWPQADTDNPVDKLLLMSCFRAVSIPGKPPPPWRRERSAKSR
mgnify:CR=1 FL=1